MWLAPERAGDAVEVRSIEIPAMRIGNFDLGFHGQVERAPGGVAERS
jgi:hypothetical protein